MAELLINIPDAKEGLVKELVINLGGAIVKKKAKATSKVSVKVAESNNEAFTGIEALFGTWKGVNIDPRKLREEVGEGNISGYRYYPQSLSWR